MDNTKKSTDKFLALKIGFYLFLAFCVVFTLKTIGLLLMFVFKTIFLLLAGALLIYVITKVVKKLNLS